MKLKVPVDERTEMWHFWHCHEVAAAHQSLQDIRFSQW
jgi:hypothetical protein